MTWQNILPHHGIFCDVVEFFDKPWNILPCHIHGFLKDEQWFINFEHGFGQESH
jgi:hypothetical protein